MQSLIGLLILCLVHSVHGQAGSGIIGFGISFYKDLCCQACRDSLSSLYLSCTTFGNMTGMSGMSSMPSMGDSMGTTTPECYASNTPWLQTMAYCIQQKCDAHGYPADKQAECFKNQAVGGASSPTFHESLPTMAPTVELAANATWLNVTSLVNGDVYHSTYGTHAAFAKSEHLHTRYSLALYLFVIGVCVCCGVLAQLIASSPSLQKRSQVSMLWPKLRQYILLPALIGSRRLEPLPGQIGYVPRRTLSIFIAIYIILNIIFSAVGFHTFQPNVVFKSRGFELCEYVGNRTGTLSLVNASIAILFAGRNNPLITLTGWTLTTFLTLHRWTARVATVQAIVHSVVYTIAYWQPGYDGITAYSAKVAEPFYLWGIIATLCFSLLMAFSILPLRINFYEAFLIIHIFLVILALIGCWYHLVLHFGYTFGYQVWLYISFAYWAFERTARIARVALYNHLSGSTGVLVAIPDSDVMELTVYPRTVWGFGPGQHSMLYFPTLGRFWENHPFSVAGWKGTGPRVSVFSTEDRDQCSAAITFLIHAHDGATSQLSRRLATSPTSSIEVSVYTEGPYAGHRARQHSLSEADTILCIVGGIGITGVIGFIQEYAEASISGDGSSGKRRGSLSKPQRLILAWTAREISVIEHVRREFLDRAPDVECLFWCTGIGVSAKEHGGFKPTAAIGVNFGRMDIGFVIKSCLDRDCRTAVLVCGPGRMADEVTEHVVTGVKDGFALDLIEEAFAW